MDGAEKRVSTAGEASWRKWRLSQSPEEKLLFRKHRTGRHPHLRARQGPRQRHLRRKGGGRCMGALRGCRQRLPTGGWCEPRTHEPGRGSTPTLPEAPWGCWLPGLGNIGPC